MGTTPQVRITNEIHISNKKKRFSTLPAILQSSFPSDSWPYRGHTSHDGHPISKAIINLGGIKQPKCKITNSTRDALIRFSTGQQRERVPQRLARAGAAAGKPKELVRSRFSPPLFAIRPRLTNRQLSRLERTDERHVVLEQNHKPTHTSVRPSSNATPIAESNRSQ